MLSFGSRFLICNIFIIFFIGLIVATKRIFKNHLSGRVQYNLWFLLFVLLSIPFLPIPPIGLMQISSWLDSLKGTMPHKTTIILQNTATVNQATTLDQINDFAVSVSQKTPSFLNIFLLAIWIIGMSVMIILAIRSKQCLYHLEKSALPLQNNQVWKVYDECLLEMKIKKQIPIYSTAFLKSPITVGFIKPKIYIPIHLISDFNATDMRFMLLHELQHYRHKDAIINHLMNLTGIIYWFNPIIWYALKEIRCDREIACDSSVLQILKESDYKNYGNTLIHFAEKISLSPFAFATGIGGNMAQIKRRILNIANFQPQTFHKRIRGIAVYLLITTIVLGLAPVLSTYAVEQNNYIFNEDGKNISYLNLSSDFDGYNGSFVLYNDNTDTWNIYNEEAATKRVTPNSTYKIYDALLGLESGIITPTHSQMAWNGEDYPFDSWESDQDLTSAMHHSVNWYFQSIDFLAGADTVKAFLQKIGYGNQTISDDLELYWTDFSLKISPIEQVELLKKFYHNDFNFSNENVTILKDALRLASTSNGSFYGKTGTGRLDGEDINGWFIGYIEKNGHLYYFATNIQSNCNATGSKATEITQSILSDLQIWE